MFVSASLESKKRQILLLFLFPLNSFKLSIYIWDYELYLLENWDEAQVILGNNMHLKISSIILLKVFLNEQQCLKILWVWQRLESHSTLVEVSEFQSSSFQVQARKMSSWFIDDHNPAIGILIEKYFSRMHRPNPLNYPRSLHGFTTLN